MRHQLVPMVQPRTYDSDKAGSTESRRKRTHVSRFLDREKTPSIPETAYPIAGEEVKSRFCAKLGKGAQGSIYLVELDRPGHSVQQFAMKNYHITRSMRSRLFWIQRELMGLLLNRSNPHVAKFHGGFISQDASGNLHIRIVMDLCKNEAVNLKDDFVDEAKAKMMTCSLVLGLIHSHKRGISHRDIKPDNILVDQQNHTKLIDFGLCHYSQMPDRKLAGTGLYLAPELWRERSRGSERADFLTSNREQGDVWSLGMSILGLISGETFFSMIQCETFAEALPRMNSILGKYCPQTDFFENSSEIKQFKIAYIRSHLAKHLRPETSSQISEDLVDFLAECLTVNSDLRPSLTELCQHKWIRVMVDEVVANDRLAWQPAACQLIEKTADCYALYQILLSLKSSNNQALLPLQSGEQWVEDLVAAIHLPDQQKPRSTMKFKSTGPSRQTNTNKYFTPYQLTRIVQKFIADGRLEFS